MYPNDVSSDSLSGKSQLSSMTSSPSMISYGSTPNQLHELDSDMQSLCLPDLRSQMVFLSLARNLEITRFELRLLKFFHAYCIPMFSFGMNSGADRVWRQEVPIYFTGSKLIRSAVFAFSCINLWPLCDVVDIKRIDDGISKLQHGVRPSRTYNEKQILNTSVDEEDSKDPFLDNFFATGEISTEQNLFYKTSNYFLSTLNYLTSSIQVDPANTFQCVELFLASNVMFAFLGVHPHRLVPLIDLDGGKVGDDSSNTDFMSICFRLRNSRNDCFDRVLETPFKELMLFSSNKDQAVNKQKIPLIEKLKEELQYYSSISYESNIIESSIDNLKTCMQVAIYLNYPIPIFTWTLLVSEEFYNLAYDRNYLALKILFVYSCLNSYTSFKIYNNQNMWADYINWYAQHYTLDHFEQCFHKIVIEKGEVLDYGDYELLRSFDPEKEVTHL